VPCHILRYQCGSFNPYPSEERLGFYTPVMRRGVAAAALLLAMLAAVPSAGASRPRPFGASMTVDASPHTTGAHVRLTLTLRYEMRCGYPGAGPLVVTFPSAFKLPKQFAAGAVRSAGEPLTAKVEGRNVTVTIPRPKSTLCNVIGPGAFAVTFTRAAKLVNPAHAGSYRLTAAHARHHLTARLAITAA
jgi:hypothetical protein